MALEMENGPSIDMVQCQEEDDYWPNSAGFDGCGDHDYVPEELTVTGRIPDYCCGTLLRTGPSSDTLRTLHGSQLSAQHWFDGFAQMYRFQIVPSSRPYEPVRVFFSSRSTTAFGTKGAMTLEETCTFAQSRDPCESFFAKVASSFNLWQRMIPADSTSPNLNVVLLRDAPGRLLSKPPPMMDEKIHDRRYVTATSDTNGFLVIDADTLEPKLMASQTALHRSLQGPSAATHYSTDPVTGDLFNYNLAFHPMTTYRVLRVNAVTKETEILATIIDAPPAYIHSTFLTEHYVVLCIWGARFAWRGLKVLWTQNIIDSLNYSEEDCLWYVVDRTAERRGVVATYTSDAFFAFHTVNAYEEITTSPNGVEQTSIIADVATYDDLSVLKKYYYENVRSDSARAHSPESMAESTRARLTRFRLADVPKAPPKHWLWDRLPNLTRRRAEMVWRVPSGLTVETPSINSDFVTKKHRYVYGMKVEELLQPKGSCNHCQRLSHARDGRSSD